MKETTELVHSIFFPQVTQETLLLITCIICLTGLVITGMITNTRKQ